MKQLTIERQNGNIPKTLAGQDHVSGLMFYVSTATQTALTAFATEPVKALSVIDSAEAAGITADNAQWEVRLMHYQISEVLRINPGVTLYVGVFKKPTSTNSYAELKTMQNYAQGALRQVGIWDGSTEITAAAVTALQGVADALDRQNAPLSVAIAPKVSKHSALPQNIAGAAPRVSVVIAQDADEGGTALQLFESTDNSTNKYAVSAIGVWLGHVSLAAVHESICWVKKFPSGISRAALSDGTLVRNIDKGDLEKLDNNRYLFLEPLVGVSGTYWNDSHNMDAATSDYNAIELVRTMDKAVRGIRTYLTPELGGNIYIDAESGKMQPYTVSHLQTTANKALEDMEKAGELSGYAVEIDAEQDVLSTGTVEVVIKNVPVGVVRRINVKIGYVKQV